MTPEVSVIVPMRNEAPNVRKLYSELTAALEGLGRAYEIVVIDDAARETFKLLAELQESDIPALPHPFSP